MERVSTTFKIDFSIADHFGVEAIKDTFDRAFKEWGENVQYIAELAIVLNHKCWDYYFKSNEKYSRLYADLYHQINDYAYEHFEGDDIQFYFSVTD